MTVPGSSFLFFISSPPVYPPDLYLKHWYNVRLPIGLGCEESDFITHLRLTERTTAGEREGEVKKLNGLWGYLKGTAAALSFSMWSLASISYYIIHHSNQEQGFVCGRGCSQSTVKDYGSLCVSSLRTRGLWKRASVCPGAERYKERRALQAHLCVFCTHMKTYITATMLNCKITFCDSKIHVYSC